MLLHELDEDVLSIIVSYLSPVREDVINVALTCRALYPLAKYPEHISIICPSPQFLSLTNLLIADPIYGSSARSVNIRVEGPKNSVARHKIHTFLQRVPNLQSLTLDADITPHYSKVLLSKDLLFISRLQYLKIIDSTLTLEDILSLLALPKLRHLDIPLHAQIPPPHRLPEFPQLQLGHLRSFHLGTARTWLKEDQFAQILAGCSVLESLEWSLALSCIPRNGVTTQNWVNFQPPIFSVSPARTLSTLSHVSQTLVHLRLSSNAPTYSSLEHDGSRLDLSYFSALKTVEAGAEFFFLPVSQGARDGLYALLPRSIQSLKILFGRCDAIFFDTNYLRVDEAGRKRFEDGTMDASIYRFIVEIAEMKKDCFPFLKHFAMLERNGGRRTPFVSKNWELPLDINHVFAEADIELVVSVRLARRLGEGPGWVRYIPPTQYIPPSGHIPPAQPRLRYRYCCLRRLCFG